MSPEQTQAVLAGNLRRVRETIADHCRRAARDPGAVRVVAVTKSVELDVIRALLAVGVRDLGESRVQQLAARAAQLGGEPAGLDAGGGNSAVWHMVGHVQRNKVRTLLRHCRVVHSLDSLRLAEALAHRAAEAGAVVDVFIEVDLTGQPGRTGASPAEAPRLAEAVRKLGALRLRGLMTMAPLVADPREARPCFAGLRGLLERLRHAGAVPPGCDQLSMGMSHDYAIAVEEGATLVRIGTALFEGLAAGAGSAAAEG